MKSKHYLLFIGIALLVFTAYATLRETTTDADTAAFLMIACKGDNPELNYQPLSFLAFKAMPCNTLFFKALACLILLACTLIVAKTGELFDKENGWIAGLFAFINGLWISDLIKLEEQSLAYPLVFLSFYFLLRYISKQNTWQPVFFSKDLLLSSVLMCITALFWRGAYIFAFLIAIYWVIALIIAIPAFLAKIDWWKDYWTVFSNPLGKVTLETLWGFGIIHQWMLLLGALTKRKALIPAIAFTLAIAFMAQKYTLYAVPFLAIGLMDWLNENKQVKIHKAIIEPKVFAIMLAVAMISITLINLPIIHPTNNNIQAIKELVSKADGNEVINDWGDGWWVKFYDGNTKYFAGLPNHEFKEVKGTWELTREDTNCKVIKVWPEPKGQTLRLVQC